MESALNVRSYELFWTKDGSVNVAFSREVNDDLRLISSQRLGQDLRVIDVAADKDMPRIILQASQILQMPAYVSLS